MAAGGEARTTVVVVTWRGRAHLPDCLDALGRQSRPQRTVIVDNASSDGTEELLATHPVAKRCQVRRLPGNVGYAGGLAAALAEVRTEFVAWLNDDAAPEPGWLAALEDALDADPAAAAAGSALLGKDGRVQSVGVALTGTGHGVDLVTPQGDEVFGFCGGAALLRTAALRTVGGVPAEFFCYYEDTDTAWRLRLAGWTVRSVPSAIVRHQHGASTRPGSATFHRWNERNRLAMLVRCAPATVAVRELARFTAITAVLPVRRLLGRAVPGTANFRVGLRVRVLAEVLTRLPTLIAQRRRIARVTSADRAALWHHFAAMP